MIDEHHSLASRQRTSLMEVIILLRDPQFELGCLTRLQGPCHLEEPQITGIEEQGAILAPGTTPVVGKMVPRHLADVKASPSIHRMTIQLVAFQVSHHGIVRRPE